MTPESFMSALVLKLNSQSWGTIEVADFDSKNPSEYHQDMKEIIEEIFNEQTNLS